MSCELSALQLHNIFRQPIEDDLYFSSKVIVTSLITVGTSCEFSVLITTIPFTDHLVFTA